MSVKVTKYDLEKDVQKLDKKLCGVVSKDKGERFKENMKKGNLKYTK